MKNYHGRCVACDIGAYVSCHGSRVTLSGRWVAYIKDKHRQVVLGSHYRTPIQALLMHDAMIMP